MSTKTEAVQRVKLPNLRRARQAKDLSQPELAKKAKVTTYVVAVAELGAAVVASAAEKVARALGVKLQTLRG